MIKIYLTVLLLLSAGTVNAQDSGCIQKLRCNQNKCGVSFQSKIGSCAADTVYRLSENQLSLISANIDRRVEAKCSATTDYMTGKAKGKVVNRIAVLPQVCK